MDTLTVILGLLGGGLGLLGGLCAVVVPLGLLVVLGVFLYRRNKQANAAKAAAQSWPHTTGMVLSSSVQARHSDNSTTYYPVVVYSYEVDGKAYQGQTIKAGDQFMSIRVTGQAEATVNRYPPGKRVMVYYNPENPKEAALER